MPKLTRKRIAALQTKLAPYGVGFTRGWNRDYAGLFSLQFLPASVMSPVCPMIRCGMELIERAETDPASITAELYKLALSSDSVETVAY